MSLERRFGHSKTTGQCRRLANWALLSEEVAVGRQRLLVQLVGRMQWWWKRDEERFVRVFCPV